MNVKIGIDLVEVNRFKNKNFSSRFIQNIFTKKEINYCKRKINPQESLAARFAAKEAVIKCLGNKIKYNQIEIANRKNGQPFVFLVDYKDKIGYNLAISLSHTKDLACAICLAYSKNE